MPIVSFTFLLLVAVTALACRFLSICRPYVLLVSSLLFYLSYGPAFLPFILVTAFTVYAGARLIERQKRAGLEKRAKAVLLAVLILNVGILVAGKALNLIFSVTGAGTLEKYVIIPLGVSYYTFSAVGYLLDVNWGRCAAERDPFRFLLFVCYFPHIIEGPISRYDLLGASLREPRTLDHDGLSHGLSLMLWGYFKKLLIANRLAPFVSDVFGSTQGFGAMYLAALAADVVMLYADFSGYMDIMRGVSELFGVTLEKNFDHPFFSGSVSEFWRRWHISLGTWFKDYVYMPLSMSAPMVGLYAKLSKAKNRRFAKNVTTVLSLMTVWILTGLWHGTGTGYLLWGVYYGTVIAVSVIFEKDFKKLNKKLGIGPDDPWINTLRIFRTWLAFAFGRLLTKGACFGDAAAIIGRIFTNFRLSQLFVRAQVTSHCVTASSLALSLLFTGVLFAVSLIETKRGEDIQSLLGKRGTAIRWTLLILGVALVLFFGVIDTTNGAAGFAYQQF